MGEERVKELLKEAAKRYDAAPGGMIGLDKWRYSFIGDDKSAEIATKIYNYMLERNTTSDRRLFSIDSIIQKEIAKTVFNVNNLHLEV